MRLRTSAHQAGRPFATRGQSLDLASRDLLVDTAEGDTAVLRLDAERAIVVTTDFFTPIVDDSYNWGRIAAANPLSDVYVIGRWSAAGRCQARSGGCLVTGGHTVDDPVLKYGMAVVAHPDRPIDRAEPGSRLVLTKAISRASSRPPSSVAARARPAWPPPSPP